ncbi:MAG: hypothetical protein ACYC54_10445 [Sedimentisphaerales bacterium]
MPKRRSCRALGGSSCSFILTRGKLTDTCLELAVLHSQTLRSLI